MNPRCLSAVSAAAGREITAAEGKDLESKVVNAMRAIAIGDRERWATLPPEARLQEGAQAAAERVLADSAEKQRRVILSAQKAAVLDSFVADANARGLTSLDAVKRTQLFNADGKSRFFSVESQINAIRTDYMRQMLDAFEATEPRLFGLIANKEGIRAFTMELRGEESGSKLAKEGARLFLETAEAMRQRFNAAGGSIGRLDRWGSPQTWRQERVAAAGLDAFVTDWLRWADRSIYTNLDGTLMNDAEMSAFLREAGRTLAQGGINKIEPGSGAGRGNSMIANRGNEARQLHAKDAQSFLEAQAKYGANTLEQVLAGHISSLARDIAMVETYGPNPDATLRLLVDRSAQADADRDPTRTGKIKAEMRYIDNVHSFLAGRREPVASQWLAKFFDDSRQWLIGARLGSSTVTALVDESTLHITARVNGLSHMRLIANELATLNPADRNELAMLRRAGLGLESMTSELNRWGQENLGRSFASRVAETSMRLSRLDALDAARRRALGATIYDALGKLTREHETIGELGREDIGVLKNKGVDETTWQVWRKAETSDWGNGNSHVLEPDAIMRIPDADLAGLGDPQSLREQAVTKLLAHVLEEGQMAVPSPGVTERLMAGAGGARGALGNELYRSLMLFKSFPLAMIRKHWMRASGMETAGGRAAYIASLVIGTTILGAVAQSINNILSGKDPQRLLDPNAKNSELVKNWAAAFLKGGSMGMYGDFLFSSISKNGQNDLFGTLAGPALGLVQESMNVTQGNLIQYLEGKPTHIGAEGVKFVKGLAPAPFSTLWYTKAAMDHLLWQQAAEYLSPGYLSRMQARAQRDFNERFWWQPGAGISTARAPDLTRAIAAQ